MKKLRAILGIIRYQSNLDLSLAPALELVLIRLLTGNLKMQGSPYYRIETFQFLVERATNTAAITVTVHPDVYAKLTDEGNAEWHAVNQAALARQITFATE